MEKQNPEQVRGFAGEKKGAGKPFLPRLAEPVKAFWLTLCKRRRLFLLRRLARYYSQAVRREWDRAASVKLDAITFLLEAEAEEVAG